MAYDRIRPFPALEAFEFPELRALAAVWQEKKVQLEGDGAYKEFIKKLQREWAIETGIIERLYTWDRGVTEVLIEQGIEASIISHRGGVSQADAEHIQALINDHLGIVDGLFGYGACQVGCRLGHAAKGWVSMLLRCAVTTESRSGLSVTPR